jgi:aminoglycoside phosphotransferase (APT) family kinase protein
MERVPGRTLLSTLPGGLPRMPRLLAETSAALHRIDPQPALAELLDVDFTRYRKDMRQALDRPGMEGLRAGLDWLDANFPTGGRRALVHLDLHPGNVMVESGHVTGVIDWPNAALGDPAADVAVTRVTTTVGPLDAPGWARIPLQGVRRWLAWRFTRLYTRTNPIPMERIRYYEALRCYHAMHRVAAARLDVTEGRPPFNDTYAWRLPEQVAAMTRLFERNTGVRLILPPAAGA